MRPAPLLVFFGAVRVAEKDGVYLLDPANWMRLRLLLEPFERVRLVAIRADAAGPDWRPLPIEVALIHEDIAPRAQPVTAVRRIRVLLELPRSVVRAWRHARDATAVGGVWLLQPVFLGGWAAARLLRRPFYAVGIGSTRAGFGVKAEAATGLRRAGNRLLERFAGAVERSLARRSHLMLTTGARLAREWGGGVPFSTSMMAASDLRQRVDTCTGEHIVWAFTGGLSLHKGVDTLLEALALARRDDPRHRAVLVGHVDPNFGLEARLDRLGLREAVEVTGRLPWGEAMGRLRAADVYVFLSLHEGLPKAPLEAMGQSLPVLVTPTGAEQYVTDGENGLVVPVGDAAAVAAAVRRVVEDGPLRRRLIAAAYRTAAARTHDVARADVARIAREAFPELARTSPSPWP